MTSCYGEYGHSEVFYFYDWLAPDSLSLSLSRTKAHTHTYRRMHTGILKPVKRSGMLL